MDHRLSPETNVMEISSCWKSKVMEREGRRRTLAVRVYGYWGNVVSGK